MAVIYLALLGMITGLVIYTWNTKKENANPFSRAAAFLLGKLLNSPVRKWMVKEGMQERLWRISGHYRDEKAVVTYYTTKLGNFLAVFAAGCAVAAVLELTKTDGLVLDTYEVERGTYGSGTIREELSISVEDILDEEPFVFEIQERKYTEAEIKKESEKIKQNLCQIVLNGNDNLKEVKTDLVLPDSLGNSPLKLKWNTAPYGFIDNDGTILTEVEEDTPIQLTAVLSYDTWQEEIRYEVILVPPDKPLKEQILDKVEQDLKKSEQEQAESNIVQLPEHVDGKQIIWKRPRDNRAGLIFLLFFLAAIVIYTGKDKELQKEEERRKQQLLIDYPEVVSKIILLMGAGMTIPGAFAKIAGDYKKKEKKEKRYVYEEMLITCNEMETGVSKGKALENFGKRCGHQKYRKLSALLVQNLKKGTRGLTSILEEEMVYALEERKQIARRMGEEAGTKLLFPMILMLVVVIVILVFPALMAFQI